MNYNFDKESFGKSLINKNYQNLFITFGISPSPVVEITKITFYESGKFITS